MTQDNNEEIALTTDVGSDGDLLVEQFLGFAKSDISDEDFEKLMAGQTVEGVTAYKPATYYKI
ncbi:MAG: hypothetical protein RSC68_24505, partial [Acinetobacter sp.]